MVKTYKDFFKVNTELMLSDSFKQLKTLIKGYSNNIEIYENEQYLYFSVKDITNFKDYNKLLCNYAFYNPAIEYITEKEFKPFICDYNLRVDLIE